MNTLISSFVIKACTDAAMEVLKTKVLAPRNRRQVSEPDENHHIARGIYQALVEATLYRCKDPLRHFKVYSHYRNSTRAEEHGIDVDGYEAVRDWAEDELVEITHSEAGFFEGIQLETDVDPLAGFDTDPDEDWTAEIAQEMQEYVKGRLAEAGDGRGDGVEPPPTIFTTELDDEGVGADVPWGEFFRDSLRAMYKSPSNEKFERAVNGFVFARLLADQRDLVEEQRALADGQKKVPEAVAERVGEELQEWGQGIPAETKEMIEEVRSRIGIVILKLDEGIEKIDEIDRKVSVLINARKRGGQEGASSWGLTVSDTPGVCDVQWFPKISEEGNSTFQVYGRAQMGQWERALRDGTTKLFVIHGEGGVGKSTVMEKLWSQLRPDKDFDAVEPGGADSGKENGSTPFDLAIPVSMNHGKPVSAGEIAQKVFDNLGTGQQGAQGVETLARLLRQKRVLVILDSLEEAMSPSGTFEGDYSDLEDLLLTLRSAESKSTAIITTRELPKVLREPYPERIQAVQLEGLSPARALDAIKQDLGSDADGLIDAQNREAWKQVARRLGGNPFVCFHVAKMIKTDFDGDPNRWLEEESLPDEAQEIYNWHWEQFESRNMQGLREREVLLWLAVNRGSVSREELRSDLWSEASRREFPNSLRRLQRRFSLDTVDGLISPHSYITEFSSRRAIDLSTEELAARLTSDHARDELIKDASDQLQLDRDGFTEEVAEAFRKDGPGGRFLIDHCLVKASAPAPIRELQRRAFVQPILRSLRDRGLGGPHLRQHLKQLLRLCGKHGWGGYLAANLITLLQNTGDGAVEEVAAPGLHLMQLDLRGAILRDADLRGSRLRDVYFTQRLGEVRALALSPPAGRKQRFLAAGDNTGTVTIWRIGEESPVLRHDRHDGSTVRAVAFSPDGNTLASADKNGQVWIWRPWESDGQPRRLRTENGSPKDIHDSSQLRSLAFTKEGHLLTAAESPTVWLHALKREKKGRGGSHLVFDLNDTCEAEADDKSKRVHVIRFHGRRLYAGTKNGRVYEVDLSDLPSENSAVERPTFREISAQREVSGKASGAVPCHQGAVFAIAVSPDGKRLATGGTDGHVHVWRLPALDHVDTFNHGDEVFSLAFLGGSERLASGGEDASIAIWDLRRARLEKRVRGSRLSEGHDQRVRALAAASVSEFTTVLCSGGFDRRLIQWDEQMNPVSIVEGYANGLKGLGTTGTLIAAAYGSGAVATWDRAGSDGGTGGDEESHGGSLPERRREVVHEHEGPAYCVACAPSGEWMVSGGSDGRVMITSLRGSTSPANRELFVLDDAHNHWVWSVDVSPDGRQIASCGEDGRVHLWNLPLEDRRPILCTDGASNRERGVSHSDRARVVRYHPDSERRLLASGGYDYAVRFWDTSSGEQRGVLPGAEDWVRALDFSEKWCAAAWGESVVRVWKVDDLLSCDRSWAKVQFHKWQAGSDGMEKLLVVPTPSSILALKFRSDSQIVAGGEDTQVRVWETADNSSWKSPKNIYTFSRHEHEVTSLSILEGGFVCSGDEGGKGWIWHPEKPEEEAVAFSPLLPYQGLDLTGATRTSRDSETPQALSRAEVQTLRQLGAEA